MYFDISKLQVGLKSRLTGQASSAAAVELLAFLNSAPHVELPCVSSLNVNDDVPHVSSQMSMTCHTPLKLSGNRTYSGLACFVRKNVWLIGQLIGHGQLIGYTFRRLPRTLNDVTLAWSEVMMYAMPIDC